MIVMSLGQCYWQQNGDFHVTTCGKFIDYDLFEQNFKEGIYSAKFKFCPGCGKEITFDESISKTCHEPKVYTLNDDVLGKEKGELK